MKNLLKKLPEELINQIAAGEVVERPASVVKELLDNSIDAGADQIKIRIDEGGISLIEVSDNGTGIDPENLSKIFDPHTTSKISSMEDLNKIMTMGFRGEALSTIKSVARVSVNSKYESAQIAHNLNFEEGESSKKSARNQGTTITAKDLFYNIPARHKFLKSAETEYRKVLETVMPYFIQFPNIHFILEKNGKEVYNLPKTSDDTSLEIERIKAVLKNKLTENLLEIKGEGAGSKVSGFVGHPSLHQSKTSHQYIFINKRPIWDNGIAKSVHLGFKRLIPQGEKVPFIIAIEINPELVDVNVHPRKEEVKFINPFRVYSLVEEAVSKVLTSQTHIQNDFGYQHTEFPRTSTTPQSSISRGETPKLFDSAISSYQNKTKEINFSRSSSQFDVGKSLEFSKELLTSSDQTDSGIKSAFQLFNKYIFLEFEGELWVMDQHAAAERITFEKLTNNYNSKPQDIQNLLVPVEIEASPAELSFVSENIVFFNKLGFEIDIDNMKVSIKSSPAYFQASNIEDIFKQLWQLSDEQRDMKDSFEKAKENILATMACHSSIRSGQSLTPQEGIQLYKDLKKCENPYSCPHGRPVLWKMRLEEIDTHFERTY